MDGDLEQEEEPEGEEGEERNLDSDDDGVETLVLLGQVFMVAVAAPVLGDLDMVSGNGSFAWTVIAVPAAVLL